MSHKNHTVIVVLSTLMSLMPLSWGNKLFSFDMPAIEIEEANDEAASFRQLDATLIFDDTKQSSEAKAAICEGGSRGMLHSIRDKTALAKKIADKEIRDRVLEQVDFDREQVVLAAWTGGSNNRPYKVETDEMGTVVFIQPPITFQFSKGDKHHVYLYALPSNAKWLHKQEPTQK